jgi:hypothetical protein
MLLLCFWINDVNLHLRNAFHGLLEVCDPIGVNHPSFRIIFVKCAYHMERVFSDNFIATIDGHLEIGLFTKIEGCMKNVIGD